MHRSSHKWLWFSLVAIAAVFILCALGVARGLERPKVRLPDGTVLTYQEMTYGLNHRWLPKTWWQRLLGPLASQSTANAYTTGFYTRPNEKPYLVAWFTAPTPKGGQVTLWPQRTWFAADESGRDYARAEVLGSWKRGLYVVEYCRFPMPTHGDRIQLHFYDKTGDVKSSMTLSLPPEALWARTSTSAGTGSGSRTKDSSVNAKPAPAVVERDGLAVELAEATTGISGGGRNRSIPEVLLAKQPCKSGPGDLPWTRLAVKFPRGSHGWSLSWSEAEDPLGRHVAQSYAVHRGGIAWSALPGYIALDGEPLTVKVHLQRRAQDYAPARKWVIPDIKVPNYAQETAINKSRRLQGALLEVRALAAKGTTTGPGRVDLERQPYFRIFADGISAERLLSVWTIDERGRRANAELLDYGGSRSPFEYRVRVNLASDARRVSLHLAVHPPPEHKTVTFKVQPSRL